MKTELAKYLSDYLNRELEISRGRFISFELTTEMLERGLGKFESANNIKLNFTEKYNDI